MVTLFSENARCVASPTRQVPDANSNFNLGWKFSRNASGDASTPAYADESWENVSIPHDFSVDMDGTSGLPTFSPRSAGDAFTGHTVGGVGWYRKSFVLDELDSGNIVKIHFDGVYCESEVWINGHKLGSRPNGYVPFYYDLTPYLHFGKTVNVIAVRCQNRGENSRWYAGSGIYRYVHLSITHPVHVDTWGVTVTTRRLQETLADIGVSARLVNRSNEAGYFEVLAEVVNHVGRTMVRREAPLHLDRQDRKNILFDLPVEHPKPWSVDDPYRYVIRITVIKDGQPLHIHEEKFGIRTIDVSSSGLTINGKSVLLKGANIHHDNGFIGARAYAKAAVRKISLLKANGFNAIRTSHNPPSDVLLEACDRLGMLVMNEFFDVWERPKKDNDYHRYFNKWYESDLSNVVARDKNRPSVLMWSIGNEINERADPSGIAIAKKLVALTKKLDPTRPVAAGVCDFWDHKDRSWTDTDLAFQFLDIAGYNYAHRHYASDQKRHPERVMVGTESFAQEAYDNWQKVKAMPWVIGDFVWTGMDYIGEAGIGHSVLDQKAVGNLLPWPWYNAWCGDLDITGKKKSQSFYRDVVWGHSKLEVAVRPPVPSGSVVHTSNWGWPAERRSWTWPGYEGKMMTLAVYSQGPVIRVEHDGQLLVEQKVADKSKWITLLQVPYRPGALKISAHEDESCIATTTLTTNGPPFRAEIDSDTDTLFTGGDDLAFLRIRVVDKSGNDVSHTEIPLQIEVEGVGKLIGCGNADPTDMESFNNPAMITYRGNALAIVRSALEPGKIIFHVRGTGIPDVRKAITVIEK